MFLNFIDLVLQGKVVPAKIHDLLAILDATLPRPKDQSVYLPVAVPAPLLLVPVRTEHAPLARARHLSLVTQVSVEDKHVSLVGLLCHSHCRVSLALEHLLQGQLVIDSLDCLLVLGSDGD